MARKTKWTPWIPITLKTYLTHWDYTLRNIAYNHMEEAIKWSLYKI